MNETDWDESVILDGAHLSTFSGGDGDFENQILEIFVENAPGYLEALSAANPDNWKSTAHKLKGAARSIGAWRLAREAERAENLGAVSEADTRRKIILEELTVRMKDLMSYIKTRN